MNFVINDFISFHRTALLMSVTHAGLSLLLLIAQNY